MLGFGFVEPEGSGECLEDVVRDAGEVAALHLGVVVAAHAGELGDLLAAEAGDAAVSTAEEAGPELG